MQPGHGARIGFWLGAFALQSSALIWKVCAAGEVGVLASERTTVREGSRSWWSLECSFFLHRQGGATTAHGGAWLFS